MDCGKPLSKSAVVSTPAGVLAAAGGAAAVPATRVYAAAGSSDTTCSACGHAVDGSQPFCAFCGAKLGSSAVAPAAPPCPKCGTPITSPDFKFCPSCASPLGAAPVPHVETHVFSAPKGGAPAGPAAKSWATLV